MEIGFLIIFICNSVTTGFCIYWIRQNEKLRKQLRKAQILLDLQNCCLKSANKILANKNKEGEQK